MIGKADQAPAHHRQCAGFTLLELLIVLVIIALAVSVVIPMVPRGSGERDAQDHALAIATQLNLARSLAIRSAREVRFIMEVEDRAFRVGNDGPLVTLPRATILELKTAKSERLDETSGAIRFFPDGSSTGGRVGLALGEHNVAVFVDWMTGRVTVGQ